jgi:hypothetical protein
MARVLLVMGHRNTDGGNADEAARTPLVVEAAARALTAAGHRVHVLQRDDGIDGDPTFTHARLGVVADRCTDLIRRHGIQVMIDAHFQGGTAHPASGCFCIFPDGNTLNPRPHRDDGKAANHRSVAFAARLAEEVSRETGIRRLPLPEPGFLGGMSERQTGVGGQGDRLGMFWRTLPVRPPCVTVVMEHGDIVADAAVINAPGFYDKVGRAYVRAVDAFWPVVAPAAEFFAFADPREFTAHAGAIGRRFASTDAEIVREYRAGERIRCVGYYAAQPVAGSDRWLRAIGDPAPRIHSSGVVEPVPDGLREPSPPGDIAPEPTEQDLARADARRRGDPGNGVVDPAVLGCDMLTAAQVLDARLG